MGFLLIVAILGAAVFIFVGIGWLAIIGVVGIIINAVIVLIGLAIIIQYVGSPIAWLIGSIPLLIGGYNLYDTIPKLIKYGDANHD